MDWKLILDEKPHMGRLLIIYDPDSDEFILVLWNGNSFIGYDNSETYEKYNLYWSELTSPDAGLTPTSSG